MFEEYSADYERLESGYTRSENGESLPLDRYVHTISGMMSKYYRCKYELRGGPSLEFESKTSSMSPSVYIRLLDDEWFMVSLFYRDTNGRILKTEFWKCDQLHGLRSLLIDKKIIDPVTESRVFESQDWNFVEVDSDVFGENIFGKSDPFTVSGIQDSLLIF